MTLSVDPGLLVGFLLALVRASAWLVVAPPFNSRAIPSRVKLGLAGALALFVAPRLAATPMSLTTPSLVAAVALQIAVGLTLGFVALVLFSAVQAAGSMIDLMGGLSLAQAFDPFSNVQSSVFGRFYQMLAVVMLFAINGHLLMVEGFLRSFRAVPARPPALGDISRLLVSQFGTFFTAAIEIAAPLLAALFLAEVALGLLSRAAPQLNVFVLGFPLKILLTLLLAGLAIPLLPDAVSSLLEHTIRAGGSVVRAFG